MTLLVDAVATRLDAEVGALKGRVEYVADLTALVEQGVLPQAEVAAFVLELGFDDLGGGSSSVGIHIQNIADTIGVVLIVRTPGDAKAKRGVPKIDTLREAVIATLAGWTPEESPGVFEVVRGRLVSVLAGAIIYQLDFKIVDQVRIT